MSLFLQFLNRVAQVAASFTNGPSGIADPLSVAAVPSRASPPSPATGASRPALSGLILLSSPLLLASDPASAGDVVAVVVSVVVFVTVSMVGPVPLSPPVPDPTSVDLVVAVAVSAVVRVDMPEADAAPIGERPQANVAMKDRITTPSSHTVGTPDGMTKRLPFSLTHALYSITLGVAGRLGKLAPASVAQDPREGTGSLVTYPCTSTRVK